MHSISGFRSRVRCLLDRAVDPLFDYDPARKPFRPHETDTSFGKNVCCKCRTAVAATDYIFTRYPERIWSDENAL